MQVRTKLRFVTPICKVFHTNRRFVRKTWFCLQISDLYAKLRDLQLPPRFVWHVLVRKVFLSFAIAIKICKLLISLALVKALAQAQSLFENKSAKSIENLVTKRVLYSQR